MKTVFALSILVVFSIFCSCQKQQTEAERKAEIDREVQQRLDAEHQAQEKEQLAQRETELSAREKELAEKESAAGATTSPEQEPPSTRIEQRTARIEERRPTASYNTFYTKLEPYGAWREAGDYGYVWQPREAESSRSWRPYTNGHWVYTDAGWTWISDEPFGWATYHYGRWTRLHNIGWVWVPGDEWAPAWVSWRKSNDYVGWAPLPPEARFDRRTGIHNWSDNYYDIGPDQYSFVPVNEFGAQRIETTVVPRERNVTIVNQTTNVTNITYSNTTVINQGPDYDEVRSRSREPIQRLRLERETTVDFSGEGRPMVRGEVVVVAAPVIAMSQRPERPPSVKETIAQTAVDLGWAAITDHQEAEKARAKMKSEAKAPADAPPKKFVKPASESAPATDTAAAPATSTSSSTAVTATAAPTATSTPTAIPRATSSPSVSPRQSRLLTPSLPPRRATPVPTSTSSVSPVPSPASSSSPTSAVSSTPSMKSTDKHNVRGEETIAPRTIPTPTPSPLASAAGEQREEKTAERKRLWGVESQAQKFRKRQIVPMTSPAFPTSTPASTSSPSPSGASAPSTSPAEKLSKGEKKEQNREEKERKREGNEAAGAAGSVSPSPSP
jgi:hypothetical protein